MKLCKTCKYWYFKVSAGKAWGICLNKHVQAGIRVSTVKCQFPIKDPLLYGDVVKEVSRSAQVMFEENSFGCIYWEPEGQEHWYRRGYGLIDVSQWWRFDPTDYFPQYNGYWHDFSHNKLTIIRYWHHGRNMGREIVVDCLTCGHLNWHYTDDLED